MVFLWVSPLTPTKYRQKDLPPPRPRPQREPFWRSEGSSSPLTPRGMAPSPWRRQNRLKMFVCLLACLFVCLFGRLVGWLVVVCLFCVCVLFVRPFDCLCLCLACFILVCLVVLSSPFFLGGGGGGGEKQTTAQKNRAGGWLTGQTWGLLGSFTTTYLFLFHVVSVSY